MSLKLTRKRFAAFDVLNLIFLKLNVSTNCVELLYFKKLKLILRNHCSMINLINQYMLFGPILSLVRAFVMHPMIQIENNNVQHND